MSGRVPRCRSRACASHHRKSAMTAGPYRAWALVHRNPHSGRQQGQVPLAAPPSVHRRRQFHRAPSRRPTIRSHSRRRHRDRHLEGLRHCDQPLREGTVGLRPLLPMFLHPTIRAAAHIASNGPSINPRTEGTCLQSSRTECELPAVPPRKRREVLESSHVSFRGRHLFSNVQERGRTVAAHRKWSTQSGPTE